jgi:SNF2 family DNA or RNA helicase
LLYLLCRLLIIVFFSLPQTIQSISLLAYLAEKHNIWGPFLVVAPASTVHNWQQELSRFVPKLKALPYWGQPNDRKILRKDWNRKSIIFTEDAPFHIVVTSYDMVSRTRLFGQFTAADASFIAGRSRFVLLFKGSVAVHDFGRSTSRQEFAESQMEHSIKSQVP